jgi:hypothetical protein
MKSAGICLDVEGCVIPGVDSALLQNDVQIIDLDPDHVPSDDEEKRDIQESCKEHTEEDIDLSVMSHEPLNCISKSEITLYLRVVTTKFGVGR